MIVDLSIIIVNYNSRLYLKNCLQSIMKNPPEAPYEIIVVDNASSDGSQEMIHKEFPAVTLIENKSNEGFARASNKGAVLAQGKYLLFLNPDTVVHSGCLTTALLFLKRNNDAGIVGVRTLNQRGKLQPTAFGFPGIIQMTAFLLGLNRLFKISRLKNYSRVMNPYYVQGSFILIRRDLFEEVEGFDERFFLFFEDTDLCQRVKDEGFKIYYLPEAVIQHFGGSNLRLSGQKLEEFIKSLCLFYQKHCSPKKLGKLKFILQTSLRIFCLVNFKQKKSAEYSRLIQEIKKLGSWQ